MIWSISEGTVWYSDFGELFIGELDPKTGKVTEHALPANKPGAPVGSLDLEQDADGNLWVAMMYQAARRQARQEDRQGDDLSAARRSSTMRACRSACSTRAIPTSTARSGSARAARALSIGSIR